jgi:hypothetical protein
MSSIELSQRAYEEVDRICARRGMKKIVFTTRAIENVAAAPPALQDLLLGVVGEQMEEPYAQALEELAGRIRAEGVKSVLCLPTDHEDVHHARPNSAVHHRAARRNDRSNRVDPQPS